MPAYHDSIEVRRRRGMPLDAFIAAYLEMVDTSRNVSKFWSCYVVSISVLPDVSGYCRIYYHWGRIGTEGQQKTHGGMHRQAAIAKAHSMIESKLHKGYACPDTTMQMLAEYARIEDAVRHVSGTMEIGNETVHCQCGQPNCRLRESLRRHPFRQLPRPAKKQRHKTKQRPVQADRFILLEDDDDA